MITDSLTVERNAFETATGWELKPEGACKGEVCIPLGPDATAHSTDTGTGTGTVSPTVNIEELAEQLGLALVADTDHGLWALGPETLGGRALATAVAPELTLPDLSGSDFSLSSLRGKKVLMVAWSPY